MTQQLTKHQILDEICNFYLNDSSQRAVAKREGSTNLIVCSYLTPDKTKMCAVGRCIDQKKIDSEHLIYFEGDVYDMCENAINTSIEEKQQEYLDSILQEKYQGHHLKFWEDLQQWHDTNGLEWDEQTIEKKRKEYLILKEKYND